MHMKYNKLIVIIALVVSLFSSCDDYLTVLPENNQSVYEFWRTKEEVEAVLGAGYVKLRDAQEYMFLWGESRGNGIFFRTDGTDAQQAAQKVREMDILETNNLAKWDKLYSVVNLANSVIRFGPDVVDRDDSFNENVMKSYLSEAYFQRALAYFYLVRIWDRVPYVKTPYVDDEAGYILEQSDPSELLNACLADLTIALESAKEFFPETAMDNPINTKGRATRWAILALMADINLWLGNYDQVILLGEEIVNSNRVGLIGTALWFENFYPGNSNESIFEIQYSYALSQTNSFISWFDTNNNYNITPYMKGLYTGADKRGLSASYDASDKVWKYIGINNSTKRNTSVQNDQNWIIYRLAEIYLMEAEAYIMKADENDSTDSNFSLALERINLIRQRAGLTPENGSSTRLGMMQLLLEEKHREFFCEGKNWFDILRVGRRDLPGFKELLIEQTVQVASASNQAMMRAKLTDKNAWYLPIHADELSVNTQLVQNQYYINLGN